MEQRKKIHLFYEGDLFFYLASGNRENTSDFLIFESSFNDYRDSETGQQFDRSALNEELEKIEKPAGIGDPSLLLDPPRWKFPDLCNSSAPMQPTCFTRF